MVSIDDSTLRFDPVEALTIYQVEEAAKHLALAFDGAKALMIDLSRTDKIDTAGFQLLVSLLKSCKAVGKECSVEGISGSVENFMLLFGYECCAEHRGAA